MVNSAPSRSRPASFFFSSRRRHTSLVGDWSSDVCSSDLAAPRRAAVRKELGYAYLKVGETQSAREVFEQVLILEPQDFQAALELAFLCHETGQEARALELLHRVRRSGDTESRKTAEEAFARVDGALRKAIERWAAAVEQD